MLNKTQLQAQSVRKIFEALNPNNDPFKAVWLMSVDNEEEEIKAGQMVSAYVGHTTNAKLPIERTVFPAPRCIVEKTHRLAKQDEIEAYLEAESVKKAALDKAEAHRKAQLNVNINSPAGNEDLMKLVVSMAEKMLSERKEPKVKAT